MKNNFLAGLVAFGVVTTVGTPHVYAGTAASVVNQPLPATGNPDQFSVSGIIPEFIQFISIDSELELGDLAGPKATGFQKSFGNPTTPASSHSGTGLVTLNTAAGENGTASVNFGTNSFIRVETSGRGMSNKGPDGITSADDFYLPTAYARSVFGSNVKRGGNLVPDTTAQRNTDINTYGTVMTKAAPTVAAYSRLDFGPTASSGFTWAARVTRDGLNDYRGLYEGSISMTYFKY